MGWGKMPVTRHDLKKLTRGTVVWVHLDPSLGSEQQKRRPCVIISSDVHNQRLDTIVVIPISSLKGRKPYPHEVFIAPPEGGLTEESVAQPVQIRTVDRYKRVDEISGQLAPMAMVQISASLFAVLGGIG